LPPALCRPHFAARTLPPALCRPHFAACTLPLLARVLLCLLTFFPLVSATAKPAPKPHIDLSSPRFTAIERADIAHLPAPKPAEQQLFASLAAKTGKVMALPEHPTNLDALGKWFFARQTISHNPAVVYPLLYQNLLIAQGLLSASNLERQRLGLVVARYSAITARLNLQDYLIDARICEAFLIPYLAIAYPENGHTVSRRQILEDTYNAYAGTRDIAHQVTTLLFLLRYADSPNTKNWTRMMLARSYEDAKNYGQAIAFLKTTQPIDTAWMTRLQKEQAVKNPQMPLPVQTASPKGPRS